MSVITPQPILTVEDFPWESFPVARIESPKTVEEYAYICGMHAVKIRTLLDDDKITEIINWGAGRINRDYSKVIEHLKQEPNSGLFGIFVAIEPDDLDLYRQILPGNFSMPERPVVSFVNLDYNQSNPISRFKEGAVLLKGVAAHGEETWYLHSMPLDSWLMKVMGHDLGFRKDLFDMTITREKTTVMQKDGDLYMSLKLTKDPWPSDADGIIPQEACGGMNNMAAIYPKKPDMVLIFDWKGRVDILDEKKRMVNITVNRNLDWAGLVPEGAVAPGYYQRCLIFSEHRIKKLPKLV